MGKELAVKEWVEIELGIKISKKLTQIYTNPQGKRVIKYMYWVLYTRDKQYIIKTPEDYKRIIKALNSEKTRFVEINGDIININAIENIQRKFGERVIEEGG